MKRRDVPIMDLPPIDVAARMPSAECVVSASRHHNIPLAVTLALMKTEGGRPGSFVRNTNGSFDMGVMQVNTLWVTEYAQRLKVAPAQLVGRAVRDGCFSVYLGLDILRRQIEREGSLVAGVAAYHSRTPSVAARYLQRFGAQLREVRLGKLPPLAGLGSSNFRAPQ